MGMLNERVAVITGAGEGIGRGIARRFAKEGARVLIAEIDPPRGEHPMRRMGDPESDIAPAALFLASDLCRYVTGNTLFVDGGGHINGVSWAPELPD